MTVYIEYVVIDNFTLTFVLAALSQKITLLRVKKMRCFVASLLATAVVVWYPFIQGVLVLNVIRLTLWLVLSVILYAKTHRFVRGSMIFLAVTLLFGGAMLGINFMICGSIEGALIMNYLSVPLSVILVGALLSILLVKKLILAVRKICDARRCICDCTLRIMGKTLSLKGLIDTGNRLYDSKSGLPVIIVGLKSLLPALSDVQLAVLLSGNGEKLQRGASYKRIETLGGEKKILLLKPEEFLLYFEGQGNILFDVMVGVSTKPIYDTIEYDAILHPALSVN